jgi:hypothetical protein
LIARVWKGWTSSENAAAYRELLQSKVLPRLREIEGYRGGWVLYKNASDGEIEFMVVNFFESLEAVKKFAGPDYSVPVFEPEARELLSKVEPLAKHYEVGLGAFGP